MSQSKCPRCGSLGYEHLRTHSYCWECGYSPDQDARAALKRPFKSDRMKAVTKPKFFVPREPSAVNPNADRPGPKDELH